MELASFEYCITWLLAVIQLSSLFLVQFHRSSQWSSAAVNSHITLLLWLVWHYKLCGLTQWCALLWPLLVMFRTKEVLCFICFNFTMSLPVNLALSGPHILLLEISQFPSVFIYTLECCCCNNLPLRNNKKKSEQSYNNKQKLNRKKKWTVKLNWLNVLQHALQLSRVWFMQASMETEFQNKGTAAEQNLYDSWSLKIDNAVFFIILGQMGRAAQIPVFLMHYNCHVRLKR